MERRERSNSTVAKINQTVALSDKSSRPSAFDDSTQMEFQSSIAQETNQLAVVEKEGDKDSYAKWSNQLQGLSLFELLR